MILPQPSDDLAARRKALNDLLAEHWEYTLAHNPEIASVLGDKRWNDKLSDLSQAAVAADLAKTKEFLDALRGRSTRRASRSRRRLNKALMVRDLRQTLDDARFRDWLMPVTQIGGAHLSLRPAPVVARLRQREGLRGLRRPAVASCPRSWARR